MQDPMQLILISIESSSQDRLYRDEDFGLKLEKYGHRCHILNSTWVLQTLIVTEAVPGFIKEMHQFVYGQIHPEDKFIVAPLLSPWLEHNTKSVHPCFNL
jgi:hypothetical protein